MKQLFPILFCLMLLVACKDDEPVPVTPTQPEPEVQQNCFCTELMHITEFGKGSQTYVYDANDRLVRTDTYDIAHQNGQDVKTLKAYTLYTYDERGNITQFEPNNPNTGGKGMIPKFTYNENDLLIENLQEAMERVTTYQYSPSLQLLSSRIDFWDTYGGFGVKNYQYDEKGNLTEHVEIRERGLGFARKDVRYKRVYTFDGKAHPLSNAPAYLKISPEDYPPMSIPNKYSNILTYEYYSYYDVNSDVATLSESSSYDVTFEYNAAGYPTKETINYRNGIVRTYTYTYYCK